MPSLKIAICIPSYGNPEALFLQSLQQMTTHFLAANLTNEKGEPFEKEIKTFLVQSSMLTEGRHRLVAEALAWKADYILWCDADHVFPEDSLCRLWVRNELIVGCNYARRCRPTAPTAAKIVTSEEGKDHANLVYTTAEKAAKNEMEEVSHLGFGLTLMRTSIFDLLQQQAEREGKTTLLPLFMFTPTDDHKGMIGEDVFFYRKCREAGIKVWCDHGVSWHVGHVVKIIMTNAHAVAQEQAWIDQGNRAGKLLKERIAELETVDGK
jgi:hypothetical protein